MAICYSNIVNSHTTTLFYVQPIELHLPLVESDWLK